MFDVLRKNKWKRIVVNVRKEVVKHFAALCDSLDFGAYISPRDYFVSYIFETDKQLEMAMNSGLLEEITNYHKSLMENNGYPIEAISDCEFASREDCKKKFNGNWYYYYK